MFVYFFFLYVIDVDAQMLNSRVNELGRSTYLMLNFGV